MVPVQIGAVLVRRFVSGQMATGASRDSRYSNQKEGLRRDRKFASSRKTDCRQHGNPRNVNGVSGASPNPDGSPATARGQEVGRIGRKGQIFPHRSGIAIREREPIMIDDSRLLFAMMKHESVQDRMSRQPSISEPRFDSWIREFAERAGSSGIDRSVIHSSLDRIAPNPSIVSADRNQPETVVAAGDYLRRAMPPDRIARGAEHGTVLGEELSGIEKKYGVERRIILAIWGVESDFGSNTGDYPVVEALATLACDGRRRDLAERELVGALRILENREVRMEEMLGSWAGAMGHTQFMPSSFLAFAVDHDGDGRRDIWNPSNPVDALASTANYLAQSGWKQGSPWGIEVRLPDDFDFRLADLRLMKPARDWGNRGITAADGARLRGWDEAAVFLPAGATGPAFLVARNFAVLQKYNASGIYALAVGLFGDRIAGEGAVRAEWPANVRPLSMKDVTTMQEKLRDLGFAPGKIDGLAGPDTDAAVRSFQEKAGLVPDGHVSNVVFELLG